MRLFIVASIVFFLNIPFGYWRANTRKFSWPWILSIHMPVPVIIFLRIVSKLGWHFVTFPVLIGSFFLGQFIGGKIFYFLKERLQYETTSCLIVDLYRNIKSN